MLQMKYRKRTYYTEEQKALMWDRWQEGDSIHDIARLFDRYHSSVQGIFARCGGMRPRTRRPCRTRRDIARHSGWAIAALDCVEAGQSAIDGES
jgi:hypothetical protein